MANKRKPKALVGARKEFLDQWATLGPAWGVNRTMSQIHALLMIQDEPMNTDQIMEALAVSRGNAHANLKELLTWGLLKSVKIPGDRKEYFEAEKDVWRVVQLITRERKRKELQPVLDTLDTCLERTQGLRDPDSKAFRKQIRELKKFADLADRVMERIASKRSGIILPWILKFLA
jgi:DNA-binding transcriptional regulator GbsR (MarR family)